MQRVGWWAYAAARVIVGLLARFLWRAEITGRENVPTEGAFLLCPVHRSNIDGPLTVIFTTRRMRYLAKAEIFKYHWLGQLFIAMGAISVNRGAPDRQSLSMCIDVLNDGHPLVLFPEGGRKSGPVVEEVQEGAAYLALRAGVPIVPVGIGGSEKANRKGSFVLKPAKLRVIIGEPIAAVPSQDGEARRVARSSIRDASENLRTRLQQLFDEAEGRSPAAAK